MRILAIDPDTHSMGWALGNGNEIEALGVIRVPSVLKGAGAIEAMAKAALLTFDPVEWSHHFPTRVVVEDQWIYRGNKASPGSILLLGQAAGVALTAAATLLDWYSLPEDQPWAVEMASVKEWKGERPKPLVQSKAFLHYGWGAVEVKGYCVPAKDEIRDLVSPASSWKHVGDAVAMVLWAASRKQHEHVRPSAGVG
jgi:hypothetical protein